KNALSVSLRSAIQATDSTWRGCRANRAATTALRHGALVMRCNNTKRRSVLATWNATFIRWCQPAWRPNNWQSNMNDHQTIGCQKSYQEVVRPHQKPGNVSPARTI